MSRPQRIAPPVNGARVEDIVRSSGSARRATLNQLSVLHQSGRIRRLGRGVYARSGRGHASLPYTDPMRDVARILATEFSALEPVISSTGQLAHLMHNTPTREVVFVDVGRQFVATVVEALTAAGVIAQPIRTPADMAGLLSLPGDRFVAVMGVTDRRGSEERDGVRIAGSERALVDLVVGRARFGLPLYEEDVVEAARGLLRGYDFSVSAAHDYARRRGAVALRETRKLLASVIANDPELAPYRKAL